MKKIWLFPVFSFLMAYSLYCFLMAQNANAGTPTIGCSPNTLTVRTGQTFYLTVAVTETLDLYAWQFDATYTKQYLEWVTLLPGNHLRSDGASHYLSPPYLVSDITTNEVRLAAATRLSQDVGVNGNGAIAHLMFRALKQKTDGTNVTLNDALLVDRNALEINKSYANSGICKVIIRDDAPPLIQPSVGELLFLPAIIR
jgi:hypothetical protein